MEGENIISGLPQAPTGSESPRTAWSRRRFIGNGLLPLAAVAPALARAAAGMAASPPDVSTRSAGTPSSKDAGSGAVRSASPVDDRLTTAVYINGRGPYRFLVDTGAERTLIADEVAAQLALPRGRKVLIEGIIRGEPGVLVDIDSLRMGSLVCPHLQVPLLPRAMLNVDGYLGLDVLDRHRVVLDFRARTLTVTRPQGFFAAMWGHLDEAVVRTLGSSGRLRATNCLVDGVPAAAFVDTGAQVSVSNPALYQALMQSAPRRLVVHGPVALYGVTGGSLIGLDVNVDEIKLGELTLTYTPMVVAGLEVFDVWGLHQQPALLLGMDCLRRFTRVSIDYGRKELRFELASAAAPQPLQASLPSPYVY